jgi:hypothetical protein
MVPFFRSLAPLLRKKGEKGTKKGRTIPTENNKYQANLIPVNTDTKEMTGTTVVYNTKNSSPLVP